MDKYEYQLKLDQLKNLVSSRDYETAAKIADTINWKKVRNSKTLTMVAEVYEQMERYEDCKEVLLQAYDHSSIGRGIICRLAEVAIKSKNVVEAEEYYNEFLEIAPKDNHRYIIAYKISCLKNAPLSDRIAILEEFKDKEYTEIWAYELAALYSQAGMRERCVSTCDELILWFGDGEYVEKAMDLKRSFQPLTPAQEEKYQKFRSQKGIVEINLPKTVEAKISEESGLPEITVTASTFNTINFQEELAKSMQQIMEATEKETVSDTMDTIKKIVSDIPYLQAERTQEGEVGFDREKINETVDASLKTEFQELLDEESDGQISLQIPESTIEEQQIAGQMSIEEVLSEWEKTKRAAEAAIAAAEQKKLDMAKEQALSEANEIMSRLQALFPVLTATPGEDIPDEPETVAATLIPEGTEEQEPEDQDSAEPDMVSEKSNVSEAISEDSEEWKTSEDASETSRDADGSEEPRVEQEMEVQEQDVLTEATKTMPDMSDYEKMVTAPEPEDPGENSLFEEPKEDAHLEEVVSFATRMMQENSNVEIPVSGGIPVEEQTIDEGAQESEAEEEEYAGEDPEQYSGIHAEAQTEDEYYDDQVYDDDPGVLTEEERESFSYFLPVPGMEEQIVEVLRNAPTHIGNSITSLRGNLIIQGEEGSGKTVFATSLIKAIQRVTGKEDTKIGKISAAALNRKDFATLVPKIEGGFLIVDKAGELSAETAACMSQVMEQNTQGMVVILEDDSAGIKRALSLDYSFAKKFTGKVKIPIFTIDELVDFGKSYAREMECVIEEMGVLALYNRINNIQKLDRATTLAEVKDIVDHAIESAESGGIKKLFAKKYNENDYLILREKDFE